MALKPQHLEEPTHPREYMYRSDFDFNPKIRPPWQPYTPIDVVPPYLARGATPEAPDAEGNSVFELRHAVVANGLFGAAEDVIQLLMNDQAHVFWYE